MYTPINVHLLDEQAMQSLFIQTNGVMHAALSVVQNGRG